MDITLLSGSQIASHLSSEKDDWGDLQQGGKGWEQLERQVKNHEQFLKTLSFTINMYFLNKYFRELHYHKIIQNFLQVYT